MYLDCPTYVRGTTVAGRPSLCYISALPANKILRIHYLFPLHLIEEVNLSQALLRLKYLERTNQLHRSSKPTPFTKLNTSKMHLTLTTLLGLAALTISAPTHHAVPSPFYLVTTTSLNQSSNSTTLPRVLSLGLLEPLNSTSYYLVDQGPGYASYPQFVLADGNLHATIAGPSGNQDLETVDLIAGGELAFQVGDTACGDLSLLHGYLLAVNGSAAHWSICVIEAQQDLSYVSISVGARRGNDVLI